MATVVHLDTHVVAWLYAGKSDLLPDSALQLIRNDDLYISPIVRLELQYLFEIGRTTVPANRVVRDLASAIGLRICEHPFARVIERAERHSWTRDPFDRIIVAQASLEDTPLITKDDEIRRHYKRALWD